MSPLIQDLLLPLGLVLIFLVLGAQAFRSTTGGGEIGPKGKAYLFRGCLGLLGISYGEMTVSYYKELGLPLTALILSLLAWFVVWQMRALVNRIKAINRERQALLAAGELKLIPLGPAQKVINIVLIVWGSACILGTIVALVLKVLG
jgi:protein-S-isoprenylcysteine O-methyltransferase Ste14